MKILVIGSGGREHAMVWKIKQSPKVEALYCSPGNAGIAQECPCIPLATHQEIVSFCHAEAIDLVVVGPEKPLVEGLSNLLREEGIPVFGCSQAAAQLEGSKGFTKDLCAKYNIPTAAYGRFDSAELAKAYLQEHPAPIVIKADGLAAGKGVIMAETQAEALAAIDDIFGGKFGSAGASVVIEEWLQGEEVSFFALSDGRTVREFGCAQDHKRAFDGDTGPNTGGMGTYSPTKLMTDTLRVQVMEEIIRPTVRAMQQEGTPFQGILFAGLMITEKGPMLLEYNVRFGDPETQSLMMRLDDDLVPALWACANGEGLNGVGMMMREEVAVCVVMAANGYPDTYQTGTEIKWLDVADAQLGVKIFHAGTTAQDGKILATGGRVLGITAVGVTFQEARDRAYHAIGLIDWQEGFYRKDIGWRALASH
jgi:phosphoribosylamine--glycine ligase